MCSQTRNSCAKAFDNRSRGKHLKPKKSRGVNLTPPPPPSRLLSKTDTVTECIELTPAEESNSERSMAIVIDLKHQLWKEPKNIVHVANKENRRLKHF